MKHAITAAVAAALAVSPLAAQVPAADAPAPIVAQPAEPAQLTLPANTEILLSMNEEISSRKNQEGEKFSLSVVHDVRLNDAIVIPKGTRGVGEITWKTGKGAFGKSGKMNIELRYLELNGRTIPIEGSYRQEGEGNTVATVAAVVAVGVFGAFVTGKSALIPQGRELKAHTREAIPVVLPGVQAVEPVEPAAAVAAAPVTGH